jgi:predicted lipoprotein with Yx(FWY)xxD motif
MIRLLRYSSFVAFVVLLALAVTACGDSNTATSPTPTTAPTTAPTAQPTAPSASTALISTAQVSVQGTMTTVLTDASGKTLYYLTSDTPTSLTCTGACLTAWPPILATGTPTSSTQLPHQLTVLADAAGQQVEYDGHLLYTFAGDTGPGQATGEGIQTGSGVWHVVTPDL